MRGNLLNKNPFVVFLPFLILFIAIALLFPTNGSFGDEGLYLKLSHRLLIGFFSPPTPNIDLGNGPGYPILIMPFLALNLPLICITILNAALYYLSIVFLFKTLKSFVPLKLSLLISVFWAFYINIYEYIPIIYTEILTVFLITMIGYTVVKAFESISNKKYIFVSGFLIGYLALTKPIFGYVIMVALPVSIVMFLIKRSNPNYKKSFLILVIGFMVTIPFLIYTYSLTNKVFYWGSGGGNNLYWMSTPYSLEYGSWIEYPIMDKESRIPQSKELLIQNHKKDFEVFDYNTLPRDSAVKEIAIENIKSHPKKFLLNCFCNVGRMFFNFPYSYKLEDPKTLLRLPFNGLILVFFLFSLIPAAFNWKKINFGIRFLILFGLIYFGGSIFGSAETRMFSMIVPILLIWIAYIIQRSLKIKIKFDS